MRLIVLFLVVFVNALFAKDVQFSLSKYQIEISNYDFIDTTLNVIQFPRGAESFEPFYKKLDTLVFENKGKVNILHIGGSHLQADVISGRIREHLIKDYPGASAGRGFIFPYSAARTNTPSSYASYYKGFWDMSKNVQKEIKKPLGLLGIAVSTSDPRAEITLLLDKYNTDPMWGETNLRLFGYSDSNDVVPVLLLDSNEIFSVHDTLSGSFLFKLPRPVDTIQIAFKWADSLKQAEIAHFIADSLFLDSLAKADTTKKDSNKTENKDSLALDSLKTTPFENAMALDSMFQGDCDVLDTECLAKLEIANEEQTDTTQKPRPRFTLTGILSENDFPGIIYHNVGINGAKVANYFEESCPNFEKEMSFIKPDLVIFAIGINDANVEKFNDKKFIAEYDSLIARIKKVVPDVAIVFETNNDSFRKVRKRRYVEHPNGEVARRAFFTLAEKHKAGVWDKFSIMGGLGSMSKWEKADLAKKDKVHFKLSGYNLLGDMFYKALIDAYKDHIGNLPAETPKKEAP